VANLAGGCYVGNPGRSGRVGNVYAEHCKKDRVEKAELAFSTLVDDDSASQADGLVSS
jgi:hypothetical protein